MSAAWTQKPTLADHPEYGCDIYDETGKLIAFAGNDTAANSILASVNSRDDLVAALRGLIAAFVNPHDGGEFEDGEVPALDRARAALAKAGAL